MTLPASGQISMSQINTELGFSATAQISLNTTAVRTLAGVPSGQIDLNDFWGKSSYAATLSASSNSCLSISPTNANAGFRIDSDGYVYSTGFSNGTYTQRYLWKTGGGTVSDYQCRWTNTLGTLSGGTAGTWLACSSDNTWTVTVTTDGFASKTCEGTVEIRMAASPNTVLATASVTLEAVVEI